MVGVLIRMRLALLRNSMTGVHAAEMILGAVLGLLAAAGTLAVGLNDAAVSVEVLAALLVAWALGWMLGPLFAGSEKGDVRPEHFTRLPLAPRRLAAALLGASFVGIGPVVTVLALTGLVGFGARLGVAPTLVAVLAVPGLLAVMVLASRMTIAVLGEMLRSRAGAALVAAPWAVLVAAASNIGVLLIALDESSTLAGAWPSWLATSLRALPSGWGIVAVEAVHRADWALVVVALLGLGVLVAVLLACWAALLTRRTTGVLAARAVLPTANGGRFPGRLVPATPLGAVVAKELRAWSRDMLRTYFWSFSLWFSVVYCLLPLLAGEDFYLPWAGVVLVLMLAANANLYSADGSALWLTLMRPGTERADVRGRQVAWLVMVAPLAIVFTVAGVLASGDGWVWPWVLSLLAVTLGADAGLLVLLSVLLPIRMPDAHRRSANPAADTGNITGLVWAMIGLTAAVSLPVVGVVWLGTWLDSVALRWAGVPVGMAVGGLCFWGFGRVAYRRIERHGPELLMRLRGGQPDSRSRTPVAEPPGADAMRVLIGLCFGGGWAPVAAGALSLVTIFQGGTSDTLWTFPVRLPEPLPVPSAILLLALGLGVYLIGVRTLVRLRQLRGGRPRGQQGSRVVKAARFRS